jgi:hypothetical protein
MRLLIVLKFSFYGLTGAAAILIACGEAYRLYGGGR